MMNSYSIRNIQGVSIEINLKVRLIGPHYANIMMHGPQNFTEILVDASKGIGLEVNADKTKYMVMSRDQIVGTKSLYKV